MSPTTTFPAHVSRRTSQESSNATVADSNATAELFEKLLAAIETRLPAAAHEVVKPESPPITLRKWHAQYCQMTDLADSTRKNYLAAIGHFERWADGPITVAEAAKCVNEFLEAVSRTSRISARSRRTSIVAMLRRAESSGHCKLPPKIRSIKVPDHSPRAFTVEDLQSLIDHADPLQAAAIRLAFDSGLRRGDLFAVTWADVFKTPTGWQLVRTANKTKRRVVRRLRPATMTALEAIRSKSDPRLLPLDVLVDGGWNNRWHALGRRAGVDTKRMGLQAIRRSGATASKRAGLNASEYLGHSTNSGNLAERFYIDPRQIDEAPQLPPGLGELEDLHELLAKEVRQPARRRRPSNEDDASLSGASLRARLLCRRAPRFYARVMTKRRLYPSDLRKALRVLRLTQRAFAAEIGVSEDWICEVLKRRKPLYYRLDMRVRVALGLGYGPSIESDASPTEGGAV